MLAPSASSLLILTRLTSQYSVHSTVQCSAGPHLVLPVIVSGPAGRHDAARAAVSALVVVVVHEDHGVHPVRHAPVVVRDAAETVEVPAPDTLRQLDPPPELELQTKVPEYFVITEKDPAIGPFPG